MQNNNNTPNDRLGFWITIIITIIAFFIFATGIIYIQVNYIYNSFTLFFAVFSALCTFFQVAHPDFKPSLSFNVFFKNSFKYKKTFVSLVWYISISLLIVVSSIRFFLSSSSQDVSSSGQILCNVVNSNNVNLSGRVDNVIQVGNNNDKECIGISDGEFLFDMQELEGDKRPLNYRIIKRQVLERINAGDFNSANSILNRSYVTNDAEILIYLQNQEVLTSHDPYINIVVGTMLTGEYVRTGRAIIQGAYIAQKEINNSSSESCMLRIAGQCTKIRILIANSGGSDSTERNVYTGIVAKMISDHQNEYNIKGVIGWPFSGQSTIAQSVLAPQKIPILSPTASSTSLSSDPYFWRVAPSDATSIDAIDQFVEKKLKSSKIAVFYDATDTYSRSLGEGFINVYTKNSGIHVFKELYVIGHTSKEQMASLIIDAEQRAQGLDLIFFSGYSGDALYLFQALPPATEFPDLKVIGGDAIYDIGSYTDSVSQFPKEAYGRLFFVTFGYSDTWKYLNLPTHPFFCEYTNAFDPQILCNSLEDNQKYYYNRPDGSAILAYDATITLIRGCDRAAQIASSLGNNSFTFQDLNQALGQLNGEQTIQGASGQIALGSD